MRSEQGEGLVDGMSAEGLAAMLGSLSGITPADVAPLASAERFQREIADAERVELEGTGHFVVDDAPERYAEALVGFLRRARPGTPR